MFEAYSIGVRLSLTGNILGEIGAVSKMFRGIGGDAKALQKQLDGIKSTIKTGAVIAGTGIFGLEMMNKAIDKTKEYQKQLSLLQASGATQAEVARDVATAWKTSHDVITTSAEENLKSIRELRSVLGAGNTADIAAILPSIQRVSGSLAAYGGNAEGVANDIARITEMRSVGRKVTAEDINRNADLTERTVTAMGGTITPSDILAVLKQSKMYGSNFNDKFLYSELPFLIQENKTHGGGGASSVGTAITTLSQAVVGGVLKKSSIPLWEQLGLINASDVVKNAGGSFQLKPGAMRDVAGFQADPYQWAQATLLSRVDAYAKLHKMSTEAVLAGLFGNRNAQNMADQFLRKNENIDRDADTISKGLAGSAAYNQLLKTNPELAQRALEAQWKDVQVQLTLDVLPKLIKATIWAAQELSDLTSWMEKHRTAVKVLAYGFIGLSSAMVLVGSALTIVGGFRLLGMVMRLTSAARMLEFAGAVGNVGKVFLTSNLVSFSKNAAQFGTGITSAAMALQAAAVVAAAAAGAFIGHEIYKHAFEGKQRGDTLGGTIATVLGAVGFKDAQEALDNNMRADALSSTWGKRFNAVKPGSQSKPVQVDSALYISQDGMRQIAKGVTMHQANEMSGAQTGVSGLDTSMFAPNIGWNGPGM